MHFGTSIQRDRPILHSVIQTDRSIASKNSFFSLCIQFRWRVLSLSLGATTIFFDNFLNQQGYPKSYLYMHLYLARTTHPRIFAVPTWIYSSIWLDKFWLRHHLKVQKWKGQPFLAPLSAGCWTELLSSVILWISMYTKWCVTYNESFLDHNLLDF